MRVVVALGGNALLERRERPDETVQESRVARAAVALAAVAVEHDVVITHGNGPQVGTLSLESNDDRSLSAPYSLDVLGAETQGMIGYWLLQALENELGPAHPVAALISQAVVAADDPAFSEPAKFVGPVWTREEAQRAEQVHGWKVARDGGGWRRVVASPEPEELVEEGVIRRLVDAEVVVVCAGGGGVPVVRAADGRLRGTEAVVDKDLTAALLAERVEAQRLIILTDVPAVVRGFGTGSAAPITSTTPRELRRQSFAPGSMGPKVDAVCRFVERTGGSAAIGALDDLGAIVRGRAGTIVEPNDAAPRAGRPLEQRSA